MTGSDGQITAVLGPTNTGKTHYAIERMLAHRTGVIGLPLRLLAREVYDRMVAMRGPSVVALVTGEERIVPERAAYWVCTVEAMPLEIGADFVAVDEIQLCADPERGHVFTDRLLAARGLRETLFLGSDTMRPVIAGLVPGVRFLRRERFSELTHTGVRKISRLRPRTAIVGFSVEEVYAIAELIRRQKGGAAVVMGALSPRTRNAQVAMYQNGDVDYLVATDAIGMGLNLDITHVAFSSVAKFDGRRFRHLHANELSQIAGRAGRHLSAGTFGTTADAAALDPETVDAIEQHRFAPVRRLQWRNRDLRFGSVEALIDSLEVSTEDPYLSRTREADDLAALKALADLGEVRGRIAAAPDVRLLWEVCQIPDFRNISPGEHASLLTRIFGFLHDAGSVPEDWIASQIRRIDRTEGDIDTLSKRLAYIRTWTFIAQRRGWLEQENHWRAETRAVEDRLSDALHTRLTQRFVDRRTSVLMRRLKQKEGLVAEVNDKGEVSIEGEFVGRMEGFRFRQDRSDSTGEARAIRSASVQALRPQFVLRAERLYNAPDTEMDITEQGGLMWCSDAVGRLAPGTDALSPKVQAFVDEEAGSDVAERVQRRMQHFVDRRIAALFEPLTALRDDPALSGLARGFAFRLVEALGVLPRDSVSEEVRSLDQEARGALRRHGVRFGQFTIFMPPLLKPAPTRLRLVLWGLCAGLEEFPSAPPPGLVTVPMEPGLPEGYHGQAGYRPAGARAIRIDMLERLADMLRARDSRAGFEASAEMLSITGMTLEQFADLMQGLGYAAERGERPRARPPAAPSPNEAAADAGEETAVGAAPAGAPEAGTETAPEVGAEPTPEAPSPDTAETVATTSPRAGSLPPVESLAETTPGEQMAADAPPGDAQAPQGGSAPEGETAPEGGDAAATETEIFYTFTWAPRRRREDRPRRPAEGEGGRRATSGEGGRRPAEGEGGRRPPRDRKPARTEGADNARPPRGKGGKPPRRGPRDESASGPRVHTARPPRTEKPVDPDNPFAALLALKDRLDDK
ncbi:MAG: hypothetical protein JJU40_03605 [Rhodobacteraceae bacterium]|nr:hypothetical protein [Paracoccaceae bacterium]